MKQQLSLCHWLTEVKLKLVVRLIWFHLWLKFELFSCHLNVLKICIHRLLHVNDQQAAAWKPQLCVSIFNVSNENQWCDAELNSRFLISASPRSSVQPLPANCVLMLTWFLLLSLSHTQSLVVQDYPTLGEQQNVNYAANTRFPLSSGNRSVIIGSVSGWVMSAKTTELCERQWNTMKLHQALEKPLD